MLNVIVFRPADSRADNRKLMMDELHRGFIQLGCESTLIDIASSYAVKDLNEALKKPVNFIVTFGQESPVLFLVNGEPFTNTLKIPTISIFVDPPYQYIDRFPMPLHKHMIVSHVKAYANNFFNLCMQNYKASSISFMPQGGSSADIAFSQEQFEKRSDRILFVGSYSELPKERPWKGSIIESFTEDVYSCLDGSVTVDEALIKVMKDKSLTFESELLDKISCLAFSTIFEYDHAVKRNKILETLLELDYKIDLYGVNWPDNVINHPNIDFKGMINYFDLIKLYNNYKLSLNPYVAANGAHERIFDSIANGCQCLTLYSSYFSEVFSGTESALYQFSWGENLLSEIDTNIKKAFSGDNFSRVKNSREYVLENQMWLNRAEYLIELYKWNSLELVIESK